MNSPNLVTPPLLKAKDLLLLSRIFFKTGLVLLVVFKNYLLIMGKNLFLNSSRTFAKILI